jgi:hypothetical protein
MLSQGTHVCDVALAYPLTQLWLSGYPSSVDDSYYKEVQRQLLNGHVDYDVIDPASLAAATVDSNGLHIGKAHFKVLVLPDLKALESAAMTRINEFVAAGGILIGLNGLPAASEKAGPEDPFITGSMKKLFGFAPRDLGQHQYYPWDTARTVHYTTRENEALGKGIFTRYAEELPAIIRHQIVPDIEVSGPDNDWLTYRHRSAGGKEMFFFVNGHKDTAAFRISLKNTGRPYRWDPETGAIQAIGNYRVKKGRLELMLDLTPWEAYFIVVYPEPVEPSTAGSVAAIPAKSTGPRSSSTENILIKSSGLEEAETSRSADSITVRGWSAGNGAHLLTLLNGPELLTRQWQGKASLPELPVTGDWEFQLSPSALDYRWSAALDADTLALPVMEFRAAPDRAWKPVKVEDSFSSIRGCRRYLSGWDAGWISYYNYDRHLSPVGGGDTWFRKTMMLAGAVKDASLDITADESYELLINGKLAGRDANWKKISHYDIRHFLVAGENIILIKTTHTKGLLLEGSVMLTNGQTLPLLTDDSWQASQDLVNWRTALLYAAPPLGPWGDIGRPGHDLHFPRTVWYRQILPPGTKAIAAPIVNGKYEIFVNDHKIRFIDGAPASIKEFLKDDKNVLSLSVRINDSRDGLQKPIRLVVGKTAMPLQPWKDMGIDWYSGRALYSHTVQLSSDYLAGDVRLVLDLGRVCHFAEIWINDSLVTYRPWAPFRADITRYLHAGSNRITLVVANLLANKAAWNTMDANIDSKEVRWWNFGSLQREKEKLTSGLLGPVRIIPYTWDSIQFAGKNIQ